MAPGDGVHLVVAPLYHAAPGLHALGFLHAGHTIVIHRRFDPEQTLRAIAEHGVTSVHLVPTHFHRMLRLPEHVRTSFDLGSLQVVIHAGAPCPVPTKQRMIEWLGPVLWEYLGSTEGVWCPLWTARTGWPNRARWDGRRPVSPFACSTTARRRRPASPARSTSACPASHPRSSTTTIRRRRPQAGTAT